MQYNQNDDTRNRRAIATGPAQKLTLWETFVSFITCSKSFDYDRELGYGVYNGTDSNVVDCITFNVPENVPPQVECVDGAVKYDTTPMEVKQYRQVRRRRKIQYVTLVAHRIKNRLGLPERRADNERVVRRMAVDDMRGHGVRETHIREAVELVVEAVFTPDHADVRAMLFRNSKVQRESRALLRDAQQVRWWQHWFRGRHTVVLPPVGPD